MNSEENQHDLNPLETNQLTWIGSVEQNMAGIRIRPALFAQMCGVSKAAVSKWIKDGKVVTDHAGLIDPVRAVNDLIKKTDPAKMRAKFLKPACADRDDLLKRIETLEAEIAPLRAQLAAAIEHNRVLRLVLDESDRIEEFAKELIAEGIGDLAKLDADSLRTALDDIFDDAADLATSPSTENDSLE